jgi:hypothetical protein
VLPPEAEQSGQGKNARRHSCSHTAASSLGDSCVTNSRTGTSGSSATKVLGVSATMPHECKAGPCCGSSHPGLGKTLLSCQWLTIKLAPSGQSCGKVVQFEPALAITIAIASKSHPTRTAHGCEVRAMPKSRVSQTTVFGAQRPMLRTLHDRASAG